MLGRIASLTHHHDKGDGGSGSTPGRGAVGSNRGFYAIPLEEPYEEENYYYDGDDDEQSFAADIDDDLIGDITPAQVRRRRRIGEW